MWSMAVARHALTLRSKGQGLTVIKTVTVARLLVTMAGIRYTYTPLCYLRPLPAWVCMSIRKALGVFAAVCAAKEIVQSSLTVVA